MQTRDDVQAGNRAFKLTGMTHEQIRQFMREIGAAFSNELMNREIPVSGSRNRHDVAYCQIDTVVIRERVSKPEPATRIKFDIEGNFGVTLTIKLMDYLANPEGYAQDLFRQLGPLRRNMERRRKSERATSDAIYRALTKGGST